MRLRCVSTDANMTRQLRIVPAPTPTPDHSYIPSEAKHHLRRRALGKNRINFDIVTIRRGSLFLFHSRLNQNYPILRYSFYLYNFFLSIIYIAFLWKEITKYLLTYSHNFYMICFQLQLVVKISQL